MAATEHVMSLSSSFIDDQFVAECSCGWEGKDRNTEADAIEDFDNHCDVVFMEATGG